MADLIKLVRTYRHTAGLNERLRLVEEILGIIQQDLRFFVFKAINPAIAEDVLQEVLKAIFTSLKNFAGDTPKEFWKWCYGIARNKVNDQYKKHADDRLQPMPQDELCNLMDLQGQVYALSPQDKLDFQYLMTLLYAAKPECYELLWQHYITDLDYADIAEEQSMSYDAVRMKIGRCLEIAQSLVP
jgi:RNA polymerase sigma factor (sigma-70 family)